MPAEKTDINSAITDTLDLIDRANKRIDAWNQINDTSMAAQWERLKNGFVLDLIELLREYDINLNIVRSFD